MKKIISILLIVVLIVCSMIVLSGCLQEVSREVIDHRFTPAHDEVETRYVTKYDFWGNGLRLMPDVHSVHYPDKYELRYRITRDDGSTVTVWEEVSSEKYEEATK